MITGGYSRPEIRLSLNSGSLYEYIDGDIVEDGFRRPAKLKWSNTEGILKVPMHASVEVGSEKLAPGSVSVFPGVHTSRTSRPRPVRLRDQGTCGF